MQHVMQYFSSCNDGVGILNRYLDMVVPALVALIKDSQSEGISLAACISAAKTLSGIATTDQVRLNPTPCRKSLAPGEQGFLILCMLIAMCNRELSHASSTRCLGLWWALHREH